jgi:hypothetical protein
MAKRFIRGQEYYELYSSPQMHVVWISTHEPAISTPGADISLG